jgi:hypothetical protein
MRDAHQIPQEYIDAIRVLYYGKSEVYTDVVDAYKKANELYADEYIVEYGVLTIQYDRPFPTMTTEEANKISDDFWSSFQ